MKWTRQKTWASLLILGAAILLFRTLAMAAGGAVSILMPWVVVLLFLEMFIDIVVLAGAVRWWITSEKAHSMVPLRFGASAAVLHAIRVLIFVLGRTEAWLNFDVRPEHHAAHHERWTIEGVYFAAILSVLGVAGVVIIWLYRRRKQL